MQLFEIQVQHGLGQLVDCLGHVLFGRSRRGCDVAGEQAQKTDQHFDVGHRCFLIVVGYVRRFESSYNHAIF